jgi:uncharacterized membrane protein (DUF373 family)
MRSIKEFRQSYDFTHEDEERLAALRPMMEEQADEVMARLHAWIMGNRETARYFTEEATRRHVFTAQRKWFMDLFSGGYDRAYHHGLVSIGATHVKSEVDAHFMNRSINLVRTACMEALARAGGEPEEMARDAAALNKILDMNLDVITSAYIEEEMRAYSSVYRVKSVLVDFSERFNQSANLVLVLALIGLTIGAMALFYTDVKSLFTGPLEHGIVSSLGSLLILWVMIELMDTEIAHLKGARFRISVFVGVALVTVIRETMISTLKKDSPSVIYYLVAAVFVLGVVYWLVTKGEERLK